jgi:signal transduction histidine kinase
MLGQLTASIAHEVNQPLAAVIAHAHASMRWLSREQPDLGEARGALESIVKDATRASEVIHRVRALSKKAEIQKTPLEVNDVINEVVAFVQRELASHQVSVRLELAPALNPGIADRVQLQQVITNLVINGIEAMQAVTEPPRQLVLGSRQDGPQQIQVSVKDTGVGISSEAGNRVFEAFFTTKSGGLGMGLSICRAIIEAHGGRLWAEPNVPRGAAFHFTLPSQPQNLES